MIHIIYLSIIALLIWKLIKAYDLVNRKHKELIRFKEINKVPYEIFSNYEKAYVDFYRWMVKAMINKRIIKKYEEVFKYDDK